MGHFGRLALFSDGFFELVHFVLSIYGCVIVNKALDFSISLVQLPASNVGDSTC